MSVVDQKDIGDFRVTREECGSGTQVVTVYNTAANYDVLERLEYADDDSEERARGEFYILCNIIGYVASHYTDGGVS
jgi:uncharacterized protein with GYD domain